MKYNNNANKMYLTSSPLLEWYVPTYVIFMFISHFKKNTDVCMGLVNAYVNHAYMFNIMKVQKNQTHVPDMFINLQVSALCILQNPGNS